MNKYFYTSIVGIQTNIIYRIKLLFYAIIGILQALLYFFLWKSLYEQGFHDGIYNQGEMLTYMIISFSIQSIMPKWIIMEIGRRVISGNIILDLIKPISFFQYYLFYSIGDLVVLGLFMGFPLLVVGYVYVNILPPAIPLCIFMLSLIIGYLIYYCISFIIGCLSFWTTSIWGVFTAYEGCYLLFSGSLIPIALWPDWAMKIAEILPFRATSNIVLDLYLGKINQAEWLHVILFQSLWLFIIICIAYWIYSTGLKKVTILGS